MASRKKNNQSRNSIVTSSDRIVCSEIEIQLSDEKLKSKFSRVYEIARKDANKFRIYNHYGVFLSFGTTLLISILTSDIKQLPFLSAGFLEKTRLLACIGSLAVGVILALYNVSVRHNTENEERDKAIAEVFNEIKNDYVNQK